MPSIYLFFALITIIRRGRFTNFQSRLVQAMFLWLITSLGIYYISQDGLIILLSIMIPPLVFFLTHYFLIIKSKRLASVMFYILVILIITCNLFTWNKIADFDSFVSENINVKNSQESLVTGKKILVLSNDLNYYKGAKHGSVFFNWEVSKEIFEGDLSFEKIADVYEGLKGDLPELIIDPNELFSKYLDRIPEFQKALPLQ